MNDFIETLIALRSGLGKVGRGAKGLAKGTLENMSNVGERSQQMLDTERSRNESMINENFGGLENYQRLNEENPLPTTSIGDFFRRVLRSRQ